MWFEKRGWASLAVVGLLSSGTACSAAPSRQPDGPPVVRVEGGELRGEQTSEYRRFQGIQYAAAPIGDRRWRSPQPAEPWAGVRDATRPGGRCPQNASPQGNLGSTTEDCLYLNVTTPAKVSDQRKPVLVWVHGGGFSEEAGSDYDARQLAVRGDVVVVTVNYRLGIFGLLAYPGLTGSGGFALEDQQAALRWVQRNVAQFGGDPGNVTLAGESAGGKSACAQLASPSAAGLFQRVILQSAPCTGTVPAGAMFPGVPAFRQWAAVGERVDQGSAVAAKLGCRNRATALACLRKLPTSALLAQHNQFISPAYGNSVLPVDPDQAIATGQIHRVPAVSGITRDEMTYLATLFYDLTGKPITRTQYGEMLAQAFGRQAGRVAAQYPVTRFVSPSQAWAAVTTDRVFACPTALRNDHLAARVPTWSYQYSEPVPAVPGLSFPPGATHAAELPYLFPSFAGSQSPAQQVLSNRLIDYWAAFAHRSDPGNSWPRHQAGKPASLELTSADTLTRIDVAQQHHCDFWASIPS